MARLLTGRLVSLLATLLVTSLVIFLVLEVLPGDPAAVMLGTSAREDTLAALRQELGLDRPAAERYLLWLAGILTGDLGKSMTYSVPVSQLVADRLAITLPLALMAILFSTALAVPLGVFAAAQHGRAADQLAKGFAQIGVAIPNFWFALLFILIFSTWLGWFSSGGFPGWSGDVWLAFKALLLPAVALALPQAAILTRVTRASMLEVLGEDFVRTARAKGLPRGVAIRRHVVPNALMPVITILGLQFSFLIAGAVLVESVFSLPGLGRLAFQAVQQRDLIVVKDLVLFFAALVILVNFLVDLLYLVIDPRLRARR